MSFPSPRRVYTILSGAAVNVDTKGAMNLTIIAGTGATATYSRVDKADASAHTTGTENGTTVSANTKLVILNDWPFFRVSSSGGTTRVGLV